MAYQEKIDKVATHNEPDRHFLRAISSESPVSVKYHARETCSSLNWRMEMKTELKARNLDITITKITAKTVYYDLAGNGQPEKWKIPAESMFDKSVLVVGERYHVMTRVIRSLQWDCFAKKKVYRDRYDWLYAERRAAIAKVTARTKRDTSIDLPLVDEGSLFSW
jgi:hypothetical protein